MLLIIEGPDCSGKTTFAGAVARQSPDPVHVTHLNYGPPPSPDYNPFLEYEADFLKRLPGDPEMLTITDRLAAGELVYGPLLRGASRLSPGGLLHCEMLYQALGAVRIMMMPPLHTILARMRERGDDLIDTEDCAYIHERYVWIAPRYRYRQLHEVPGEDDIASLLQDMQDRAAEAAVIQKAVPGYIGSLNPHVVLAGDIRAGDPASDPWVHAFTPAARGSARFLFDGLAPHARSVMQNFGILNTGEQGMNLTAANELLGHPFWVSLGSNAARRLDDAVPGQVKLPHPSWVMRFQVMSAEEYGKNIMDVSAPAIGVH